MHVICPECDKKLKVNDSQAGKKVRCPDCRAVVAVPADDEEEGPRAKKTTAVSAKGNPKKPAAKKPRHADADDDDDRDDEKKPAKKKSGSGMLWLVLGGGAAVLLLGMIVCAGGVWFLFLRDTATPANPDPPPVAGDPKAPQVMLASGRFERSGDRLRLTVDYDAANLPQGEKLGCFCVFPSDQKNPRLAKVFSTNELRNAPKGQWSVDGVQGPAAPAADRTCDIVVRLAKDINQVGAGKEIGRLNGVSLPTAPAQLVMQLPKKTARRNESNPNLIEFTLEYVVVGQPPGAGTVWIEADIVDEATKERRRVSLASFSGAAIKQTETVRCSVICAFRPGDLCDLFISDVQPGRGNLVRVQNLRIDSGAPPANLSVAISGVQVRRTPTPDTCNIDVDLKTDSPLQGNKIYQCAAIFSVNGVAQTPVSFGSPVFGSDVRKGTKVSATQVRMPADASDTCTIIVREFSNPAARLGQIAGVGIQGSAAAPTKDVVLTRLRVDRIDDFNVNVQLEYEFTRKPDPQKWYTLMIQRSDIKDKGQPGVIVLQSRGDQMQMRGEVTRKIFRNGIGTAPRYRLWMAEGVNPLDAIKKISTVKLVTAGVASSDPPSGNTEIRITAARIESDQRFFKVYLDYEFNTDPVPDHNYAFLIQQTNSKSAVSSFVKQGPGKGWKKSGQVTADLLPAFVGNGPEFRFWVTKNKATEIKGVQCSNTITAQVGAAGRNDPPDAKTPIQITAATFTRLQAKKGGVAIELHYKFVNGAKPNANTVYGGFFSVKGGNPVQFFQAKGSQMKAQGTLNVYAPVFLPPNPQIDVWIFEGGMRNGIVSKKKRATYRLR
ncbi:MAG: hypothetical protein HYX68_23090 [Planctomycetes bacterium]|nr:hypothetical protein [Planctomycetota bacterium]